jgi:hypothetical protein
MRKYVFYAVLCLLCTDAFCQDEPSSFRAPQLPRVAVRANLGIPKIISSQKYRNSFSGVFSGEIGVSYRLVSNYFFGIGYNYNYFKAQRYFRENATPKINASMQMHGGFLKLGYDHFFKPTAFTTISLNLGYQTGRYYGLQYALKDTIRAPYTNVFGNAYVEPMIGVYFIVDPDFAFGMHLSYSYNMQQFSAEDIGFNKFGFGSTSTTKSYNDLHNKWGMSMITLGFGFYYGIRKK